MSLLDVAFLTLLMRRIGQQTTKLLIATVTPIFCLFKTLGLTAYLKIDQNRSAWLPISNTLHGLG